MQIAAQHLRITEIFLSIQGESSHAGRPCSFVRLTGCPMRCVWCDSEYTFTGGEKMSFVEILKKLEEFGCGLVEVTGGEPLAQKNVFPLITELCDRGYEVLIETGGFVSTENVDPRAKIILDVKCPASGEAERNHWPNLERLRHDQDEVKFVVADMLDWAFTKEMIAKYDKNGDKKLSKDEIPKNWLPGNWEMQDLDKDGLLARMAPRLFGRTAGPPDNGHGAVWAFGAAIAVFAAAAFLSLSPPPAGPPPPISPRRDPHEALLMPHVSRLPTPVLGALAALLPPDTNMACRH